MSLTVEPAKEDSSPAVAPIPAVKLVKGYMLPDPSVPNRLTIWFVGGRLSPVVSSDATIYGSDKGVAPAEWKEMFGRDQKKTWSDSIRNAGAKLFLGAELPHGMSADGSLSYQLHRPFGGHGKAYIDVLYYDENVLVTRGNRGTVYVASRGKMLRQLLPRILRRQAFSSRSIRHRRPKSERFQTLEIILQKILRCLTKVKLRKCALSRACHLPCLQCLPALLMLPL